MAGEPFLVHQLRMLHSKGFRKIVVCVGYLGELIEEKIGDGKRLGLQIDYSFDEGQRFSELAVRSSAVFPSSANDFW